MSMSKASALALLLAVAEARFGQEQIPVAAVQALGDAGFGEPGVAATIAGSIPGSLLAAASPCQKLEIADQMIAELGDDQQVIDAAIGLVSAETNFNPFAVDVPFVCADPLLPTTEALRGITPLVDPAVTDSDLANAASAESVATPFDATGLSQAEVLLAQGFSSFQAVDAAGANIVLDGQDGAGAGGDAGAGAGDEADAGAGDDADAGAGDDAGADDGAADDAEEVVGDEEEEEEPEVIECGGQVVHPPPADDAADDAEEVVDDGAQDDGAADDAEEVDDGAEVAHPPPADDAADDAEEVDDGAEVAHPPMGGDDAADDAEEVVDDGAQDDGAADDAEEVDNGNNAGAGGALDFGVCQPTMAFIGGLNGRPADEFTFIPQDPLVAEGQQEALNPNIITNRICDQLINVCDASAEAIASCEDAQAQIEALGTRDASTADTWNALLGFAGVDSSVETI